VRGLDYQTWSDRASSEG